MIDMNYENIILNKREYEIISDLIRPILESPNLMNDELARNPRARSATLRVAEKVA